MNRHQILGVRHNVSIELAVWDGAGAEVDMSCASMFAHEAAESRPAGGLAHLDAALAGHLLELRESGAFRARVGEALLIDQPPATVAARALLVIGLGTPEGWTTAGLSAAVYQAVTTAFAQGARSAALAPGMLDSGLGPPQTEGAQAHMVAGLVAALDARARLQAMGLARAPALTRWVFDAGAEHFDHAVA